MSASCAGTRGSSTGRSSASACFSSSRIPSPLMQLASASRDRSRGTVVAAGTLALATIAMRLPFMTQTLYAFDSANYALAVRDFYNVAFHQPHPPGYPLYVFFARLLDLVVHDANRSLIVEGIAWSAVAMAATIGLARAMFGTGAGLLAGLLLL